MFFGLKEGVEPIAGYRLVRPLGRGGSGEVWEASAPGDMPVALKFIPLGAPLAEPELRSLEILRHIRHPHLLDVQFVVHLERHLVVAMPLCDLSLADHLQSRQDEGDRALPLRELLGYMKELAPAIDYLNSPRHRAADGTLVGIQHRDIKPHNVFLVGDSVRLADFGLAKIISSGTAEHSTGLSPYYAAPELLAGQVSCRTDQYSFAACYVHLRTGHKLFSGPIAEVMSAHLRAEPELDDLPIAERQAVARALRKDPDNRWPDCRSFVEALLEATDRAAKSRPPAPDPVVDRTVARWAPNDPYLDTAHSTLDDPRPVHPASRRAEPETDPAMARRVDPGGGARRDQPRQPGGILGSLVVLAMAVSAIALGALAISTNPYSTDRDAGPSAADGPGPFDLVGPRTAPVESRSKSEIEAETIAARVAALFGSKCLACHRADFAAGNVAVFDRGALIRGGFLAAGWPSRSPLLTRVEEGAGLPALPGHPAYAREEAAIVRQWIKAGAPALPAPDRSAAPGKVPPYPWDEYASRVILADVRRLSPEVRRATRYLSLAHLVASGTDPGRLGDFRDAAARSLAPFAKSPYSTTSGPVDPAGLVYRVDLRSLGWDRPPYPPGNAPPVLRDLFDHLPPVDDHAVGDGNAPPVLRDLFDLVLLEYPYAIIPRRSEAFDRLDREWIGPSGMIRPVAAVRADWFVDAIARPPLRDEFLAVTGVAAGSASGGAGGLTARISPEQAAAELGQDRAKVATWFPPAGPDGDRSLSRRWWEEAFPAIVRSLGIGTPVEPVDGLGWPSWGEGRPGPAVDLTTNHANNWFQPGDKLSIRVTNRSKRPLHVELFGISTEGRIAALTAGVVTIGPARGLTLTNWVHGDLGRERICLYYAPEPFPPGVILKSSTRPDRVIHRSATPSRADDPGPMGGESGLRKRFLDITIEAVGGGGPSK